MDINRKGYNNQRIFEPQINILYAFSLDPETPVYYRIIPGNIRDISSFKTAIVESGIEDVVVVADKGFGSDTNFSLLDDEELRYVVPLKRNSTLVDLSPVKTGSKRDFDGYFMFRNRPIWYYGRKHEGKNLFVFIDDELKAEEEKDYLLRFENNLEGYSYENFLEKQYTFGTIIIKTNLSKSAKEIYEIYKSRAAIEQSFDVLKNLLQQDSTYMQNEQALEAWVFINHISMMMVYKIYTMLKQQELLSRYSAEDILIYLKYINKLKIDGEWVTSEINAKTKILLKKLNIHIT